VHDTEKFQPVLTIYSNCFSTKVFINWCL